MNLAEPLGALLHVSTTPANQETYIMQQISWLVLLVDGDLLSGGVQTTLKIQIPGISGTETREVDVIQNTLELLRHQPMATPIRLRNERFILEILDVGIGWYRDRRRKALLELLNPIMWIVALLHLPIFILVRAGLAEGSEAQQKAIQLWARIAGILLAVAAGLLALRLGISVPWDRIWQLILR